MIDQKDAGQREESQAEYQESYNQRSPSVGLEVTTRLTKVKLTHSFALENRLTQSVIVNHSLLMLS